MKIIITVILLTLISCSNQSLNNYENEMPKLDLREFFKGKIYAQGIVQERSGLVIKRFDVDIQASWKDNVCTLDEKFNYSDKTKSTRVWKLRETAPFKYEGLAHDVIGVAKGFVAGNTFYFQYNLDVPVGDKNYNIHFEDWMYLLDKKTLLARSYMTKWGFRVGEVTLVMTKKD
jgi:hypothetical protein